MKAQLDDGGSRILLGDNAGGEAIMLHGAGVWISTVSLLYTYVVDLGIHSSDLRRIRLAPGLPELNYCLSRGVSIRLYPCVCALYEFQQINMGLFCRQHANVGP